MQKKLQLSLFQKILGLVLLVMLYLVSAAIASCTFIFQRFNLPKSELSLAMTPMLTISAILFPMILLIIRTIVRGEEKNKRAGTELK